VSSDFPDFQNNSKIPTPISREVNMGKQARMEEWKDYPLKDTEEVETWRRFLGGGEDVSYGKFRFAWFQLFCY